MTWTYQSPREYEIVLRCLGFEINQTYQSGICRTYRVSKGSETMIVKIACQDHQPQKFMHIAQDIEGSAIAFDLPGVARLLGSMEFVSDQIPRIGEFLGQNKPNENYILAKKQYLDGVEIIKPGQIKDKARQSFLSETVDGLHRVGIANLDLVVNNNGHMIFHNVFFAGGRDYILELGLAVLKGKVPPVDFDAAKTKDLKDLEEYFA
jgi:hypothetical protein